MGTACWFGWLGGVILLDPWQSLTKALGWPPLVRLAGGIPVPVVTTADEGFKVTPEKLEKAWVPGTKAMLLNYPCNPTGTSYTRSELLAIAKVAKKRDFLILGDLPELHFAIQLVLVIREPELRHFLAEADALGLELLFLYYTSGVFK